ncbi:MAG: ComEC/Rec2 family competence protein [Patescibacteria group bacterium]|nr:ComEC/Rec2 family competence protein [bacterium]MDZ4241122.1 ComEC/Rec2 family competence protein [Patescibacteria group bacterium]
MNYYTRFRVFVLVFLFIVNGFIWYAVYGEERGHLTVTFLDVGQGDAIFIQAPNGNQMLIDGGKGKAVLSQLSKVMPLYDKSINIVLATHPDADHIGGLPSVFEHFNIKTFIEPGVSSDTAIYKTLGKSVANEGAKKILARRGMKINLGSGVSFLVLFPDRDVTDFETNTASIVGILTYEESSFLLTGDSPKEIENYLTFLNATGVDVDVLKAGHHGSKTSTGKAFVSATSPDYAVISAGENNSYGHPHAEVLQTLSDFGAQIVRTDEMGTIIFTSDGGEPVLAN